MNTFICYDRCSTCKKAEDFLKKKGISFQKRPIKEEKSYSGRDSSVQSAFGSSFKTLL